MDTGEKLDQIWTDFITLTRSQARETDCLSGQQTRLLGSSLFKSNDSERLIQDAAETLYKKIIDLAARHFTPPGAQTITIPTRDYYDRFREPYRDKDDAPDFTPSELWAALERDYGGAKGATKALMEAAEVIRSIFSQSLRSEIVRRGGGVVLSHSVYMEQWSCSDNRHELSYRDIRRLGNGFSALATFADWTARPVLASELREHSRFICRHHEVNTRDRFTFGAEDNVDITLITYLSKFEYRFSPVLAEQLNVFLSKYDESAMDRAA